MEIRVDEADAKTKEQWTCLHKFKMKAQRIASQQNSKSTNGKPKPIPERHVEMAAEHGA